MVFVFACEGGGGGGVEVLSSFCIRFLCAILFALKLLDKCSELNANGRQTHNEKRKG